MTQPRGIRRALFPVAWLAVAHLASLVAGCNPATVSSGTETDPARGSTRGSGGSRPGDQTIVIPDAAGAPPDTAAAPSCAAEAHKAEAVPLDLLLLVDVSGSMAERVGPGLPSKWVLEQDAMISFLKDPKTAGLGVGISFFPRPKVCTVHADCGPLFSDKCIGADRCVDTTGFGTNACYQNQVFPSCPAGLQCVPLGSCSTSGDDCLNIGQACPAGGGTCTEQPKFCTSSSPAFECDTSLYESAEVPIAELPGNQARLLRALRAKGPTGGTPMRAAVEGALKQLRAHLAKNPGRKAVLVLASDGLPSCSPATDHGIPAVAELLRRAQMETPSIATYVLGVFAQAEIPRSQPQLDLLAMAGGSNQAFVVTANGDLAMRLQETLDTIRGAALACDFKIPTPASGMLDFAKVNVRYTPTGGAPADLPYVPSLAACDPARGGWYYDVAPTGGNKPTRILTCPSTCQQFKKDGSAKVELLFGCATRTIE